MYYADLTAKFPAAVKAVCNARCNGRMGHSFLLAGDVEANRLLFAEFLAASVCCKTPQSNGLPCGKCSTCRQIETHIYPDWLELSPVGKMRQIRVGDSGNPEPNTVRYFDDHLYMTGISGRTVGVIQDADRLNEQSQNALLKTLEEPPDNCIIILSTANPSALLPTIRSRCQLITLLENRCVFSFNDNDLVFKALHNLWFNPGRNLTLGANAAKALLAVAGNLEAQCKKQCDDEWVTQIQQAKEIEPALAKTLEEKRDNAAAALYLKMRNEFLEAINTFSAQIFLLSAGVTLAELPNPEVFDNLPLPENIWPEAAEKFQQLAADLLFNLRFNVNEELAVRSFALEIAMLPAAQQ